MSRLRVGILGPGGIGSRHAAAIAAIPGRMELVASCGRDRSRTEEFARRHGGAACTEIDALLDRDLDLLIVAIPPFAHNGEVERAAAAGVNLLVEKPIELDGDRADAMVAAVKDAGVIAAVGFMYRFGEAVRSWRSTDTGPAALYAGSYHCNALHAPWWRSERHSGGQIVEQLIHQIDLVRHFMGEPSSVYARRANIFHRDVDAYDAEDLSAIIFSWDDGRVATLNASNIATPGRWEKQWSIFAERITGRFDDWNNASFTTTTDVRDARDIRSDLDVFVAQLTDLASAIEDNRGPYVPLAEGATSLRLALAARQSADERREIRLSGAR
jgi:predicted dehydrogenase